MRLNVRKNIIVKKSTKCPKGNGTKCQEVRGLRMMEGEVIAAGNETHCREMVEAEVEAGDTQIFISYDNQSGHCTYSSNFNIKLEEFS